MSHFDTRHFKTLILLLFFAFHSIAYAGIPLNDDTSPPDFAMYSEEIPRDFVDTIPDGITEQDLTLEIDGLISPDKINELTQSNSGTRLWHSLKDKTEEAKGILKSYPNILNFIKSTAPPAIRKVLTRAKVRQKYQDMLVSKTESLLDSAPEVILKANAEGFGLRLTLMGTLGLGDMLTEKMNEFRWVQKLKKISEKYSIRLPKSKFIGLGLGAGIIFLKFKFEDKNYALLRFYANGEYPIHVINVAIDGYLGLPLQIKIAEKIDSEESVRKKLWFEKVQFERSHISVAGGINSDSEKGRFQHELYWINTPSPLGAVSFYEMKIHQTQMNWVFSVDWLKRISNKIKKIRNLCRKSVAKS